ncbi:hypothetical protein DOTSEDRAFT_99233, partial [Dothistroma septosporum NZE10]
SPASQGLTRTGRQIEAAGADRIAGLTMATRAMKLKSPKKASMWDLQNREVSARRQVGDAADSINKPPSSAVGSEKPWWKNVGMEEGM